MDWGVSSSKENFNAFDTYKPTSPSKFFDEMTVCKLECLKF